MNHDSPLDHGFGFERLVGDLSARFGALGGEEIDGALHEALSAVGGFFGAERTQLSEITRDSEVHVTQSWAKPGADVVPLGTMWAAMIPGALRTILAGEIFCFTDIDELIDRGFDVDRETFLEVGTMAHLSIPVEVAGNILGVLTFGVLATPREWPEMQRDRLRLLAQVFGNALTRRNAERELRSSLAEVQSLKQRLIAEARYLTNEINESGRFYEIIGESVPIRAIFHQVEQVAPTDATILILGETGTGKELIARTVHRMSSRSQRTLVKVNCATLPSNLIESELFGHERGAFTGAVKRKIGRFEVAHEGTIFLDEIGDLPLELQAKLLRVLQDGEFERLGSTETQVVDVRVIAATNRNLLQAIEDGDFRSDLYYRLRVVPIEMPPLRERRGDIPLLAWHFVRRHQAGMNKTIRRIPAHVTEAMRNHEWLGNVRELANVIERAVILTPGDELVVDEAFVHASNASSRPSGAEDLRSVERSHIADTLERCGWKVKGSGNAAERLGLNPSTLRARMKKLGIKRP
jgi:formate hydrogenlyase transcriptional activator